VADAWVIWLGGGVATAFLVLLVLAGLPLMGLFLAAVVFLAARAAATPSARQEVDASLRRTCDRLPFCDCS
jgi:hypothetical protein